MERKFGIWRGQSWWRELLCGSIEKRGYRKWKVWYGLATMGKYMPLAFVGCSDFWDSTHARITQLESRYFGIDDSVPRKTDDVIQSSQAVRLQIERSLRSSQCNAASQRPYGQTYGSKRNLTFEIPYTLYGFCLLAATPLQSPNLPNGSQNKVDLHVASSVDT